MIFFEIFKNFLILLLLDTSWHDLVLLRGISAASWCLLVCFLMILEQTCRFLEKRNQSGTSTKSSRKVKRNQEPVKIPPWRIPHTTYIFLFYSFIRGKTTSASASSRALGTIFEWGLTSTKKERKKERKGPHLQAGVLQGCCSWAASKKKEEEKKIYIQCRLLPFHHKFEAFFGGGGGVIKLPGVLQHPSFPGSQGPAANQSIMITINFFFFFNKAKIYW